VCALCRGEEWEKKKQMGEEGNEGIINMHKNQVLAFQPKEPTPWLLHLHSIVINVHWSFTSIYIFFSKNDLWTQKSCT